MAEGRSPDLHSGNHFAYWLWKEDDGTWHLRTTAARQGHRFQGRIHPAVAGSIQALTGVGLQAPTRRRAGDQLAMVDNDVVFNFTTHENLDGLDFQLVGNSCLEFDLRIDGDSDPGKVFLGRSKTRPEKAHFVLCATENLPPIAPPEVARVPSVSLPASPPVAVVARATPPPPRPPLVTLADLVNSLSRMQDDYQRFLGTHRAFAIDFRHLRDAVNRIGKAGDPVDATLRARYDDTLAHCIALGIEISQRDEQREAARDKAREFVAELKLLPSAAGVVALPR